MTSASYSHLGLTGVKEKEKTIKITKGVRQAAEMHKTTFQTNFPKRVGDSPDP